MATPSLEPGGRAPAPAQLAVVQAFLNSADLEEGRDDLGTVPGLVAWLARWTPSTLPGEIREGDRRRLVALREALRDLIQGRDHARTDPSALAIVNDAAAGAGLRVRFEDDASVTIVSEAAGLDGFVARLMGDIATAQSDGTWQRLKVCPRDVCRWAFYDASRNRSGRWCSMAICGSRTKSARFRLRAAID